MNPEPTTIALLADPHVAADRTLTARDVCLADRLAAAVAAVLARPQRLAAVIVNGDIALKVGTPGDYACAYDLLAPLGAAGVPVHLTLGNHDHRDHFRAAFGLADAASPVPGRHVAVVPTLSADLYLLDTLDQTDSIPGRLGHEQLAWLARELDVRPDVPALVVGHHHLDSVLPDERVRGLGLLDTDALLDVLRPRRRVKAYVHAHVHVWDVNDGPDGLHVVSLPPVSFPLTFPDRPEDPAGWVELHLRPGGARLVLHGLGPPHPAHGATVDLAWRPG